MNPTSVHWFEIPVRDLAKAKAFYAAVLNYGFREMTGPEGSIQTFLNGEKMVGALTESKHGNPGGRGIDLYLDAGGDIEGCLARAEVKGGKVALPKTSIGEYGEIAQFLDPDGNCVGLHSL